ncbi:hypothetical protein [Metabacillus iocasae]|uniref:DUF5082 domain-containing protein n=1 Tax=Priestia iocasae TaxID=2291674 RepID=A0ABS2QV49_9BACI|nr:hypothetical protein [Metabacillus iocasae]MBM7703280.1 hypothetical protein [Metabacillus iocasae]
MFDSSLSTLYSTLQLKQEHLSRLSKANYELEHIYDEFYMNVDYCTNPNLPPNLWNGKTAKRFDTDRDTEIRANYDQIMNVQLTATINLLKAEISSLKADIVHLHERIQRAEEEQMKKKEE